MHVLILLFWVFIAESVDAKSAPIVSALSAKWQYTPIIYEASEYMAQEGQYYYWSYIDKIVEDGGLLSDHEVTQEMIHGFAVNQAQSVLGVDQTSNKLKLLKFSLSIHEYSPRIEMFHQTALDLRPPSCSIFYQVGNEVTCTLEDTSDMVKKNVSTPLFSHDHIYPHKSAPENSTIVVYGDFTSVAFQEIHMKFKMAAEDGVYRYVYRPYIRSRPEGKVWLSGYGVELALKSTEYKAVDDSEVKDSGHAEEEAGKDIEIDGFDFALLRANNPELGDDLTKFRNSLSESSNEIAPLKKWQLQDLSLQAACRILSEPVDKQLDTLIDISQNFPQRARSLVRQPIDDKVQNEMQHNQKRALMDLDIDRGSSLLLINGMNIDVDTTDVFMLMDMLRGESSTMDAVSKLKFEGEDVHSLTRLEVTTQPDQYKLDIRDKSIVWLNDIENDSQYKHFPPSLHELLRPAFPGTIRKVRRNMFHLVFIMDPTLPDVVHLMKTAEILWGNDVPVRIGISFMVNDARPADGREDAGVAILRAYNFALHETSRAKSFQFLVGVYQTLDIGDSLTAEHVIDQFSKEFKNEDIELIFGPQSDYDDHRTKGLAFFKRSGLTNKINVLFNGELMDDKELQEDDFQDAVIDRLLEATRPIQRDVYMGELHNSMNILDTLMESPSVVPRFNDLILNQKPVFLDLLGQPVEEKNFIRTEVFSEYSNHVKTATLEQYIKKHYLSKSDKSVARPLTLWIVADVDTASGRELVYNAMKYLKSSSHARMQFIHNSKAEFHVSDFANAIESATASQTVNNARNFITKLMKEENAASIISGEKKMEDFYVGGMDVEKFEEIYKHKFAVHHLFSERQWCNSVLNVQPGQAAVVANGRVVGPLDEDDIFTVDDFNLLESVLKSAITSKIQAVFKELKNPPKDLNTESDLIMKLTTILFQNKNADQPRVTVPSIQAEHSVVVQPAKHEDQPVFDIVAALDPASEEAQKLAPLIKVLGEIVNCNIRIMMNCREKLSDLPVKRFYRYVLQPTLDFTNIYARWDGPVARFNDMPQNTLLTLTLHAPDGWLVEATEAVYDLDNIKLDSVKSSVNAEFELECLLLEGHTTDIQAGNHPRGLQFVLGTNSNPNAVDTIVMSNLGYFQMKGNPGAWMLRLREGRSKDIYEIVGHSSLDSPNQSGDVRIIMDSFHSKIVTVKVSKQADKQQMSLLVEDDKDGEQQDSSIWNSIKSTWSGSSSPDGKKTIAKGSEEDVINIFSLASGHLYERLMRIMFVSVLRKTDAKVKFWILKNYLSPQFKNVIPKMAAEYGFDYELVQYKWPRWLNQQKEKQRTMWGYKILFLDVLFPLNVDKIIFVDADQIVRTDLRELRDLDLEGNPYGYTPFCDDKKEMDGFRFWNQGYWRNHLAGRRYHISAIYVVDLKAFRALAAGDRLRGQYQGLSQDPNSLANLDQDLPNNMIHQVGIKSLPQEWLWCETWCSIESKERAKTIDLCNNPLTKEPKLTAAVRIVPEWTEYDNEIKALIEKWSDVDNKTINDQSKEAQQKPDHSEL